MDAEPASIVGLIGWDGPAYPPWVFGFQPSSGEPSGSQLEGYTVLLSGGRVVSEDRDSLDIEVGGFRRYEHAGLLRFLYTLVNGLLTPDSSFLLSFVGNAPDWVAQASTAKCTVIRQDYNWIVHGGVAELYGLPWQSDLSLPVNLSLLGWTPRTGRLAARPLEEALRTVFRDDVERFFSLLSTRPEQANQILAKYDFVLSEASADYVDISIHVPVRAGEHLAEALAFARSVDAGLGWYNAGQLSASPLDGRLGLGIPPQDVRVARNLAWKGERLWP